MKHAATALLLGGCATAASIGPLDRFRLEGGTRIAILGDVAPIGPGAKLELAISYGAPTVEPEHPPPWLAARGEVRSIETDRRYGPRAYHNGRTSSIVHLELAVAPDGTIAALAGCPEWTPVGVTPAIAGAQLEHCAAKYVDEPDVIVQVRANPAMGVKLAAPGWTETLEFSPGMTVVNAVAYAGTHASSGARGELDTKRVRLVTRDHRSFVIDVGAIATGEQPDVPLRPGDVVEIARH